MKYSALKDKIVVVTGASRGLGEALSRAFAENGSQVYLTARDYSRVRAIAEELEHSGYKAIGMKLDVTKPLEVTDIAKEIAQANNGKIDIWVNNAGRGLNTPLYELTPEQLLDITAVNYFGLVYGTKEAARYMINGGDIVQILSTSAFKPRSKEQAYCGAKAAAEMFSRSAQEELSKKNIRVIPVFPGGMDTDFADTAGLIKPQGSMNPRDIADAILNAVSRPRNIATELRLFRQA